MKPNFKTVFTVIISFIIGGTFVYFVLKANLLNSSTFENNSINELTLEKLNLLNEDIAKYDERDKSAKSLSSEIDILTKEIPDLEYNSTLNDKLKRGDSIELPLYQEYIMPLEEMFKKNEIILNAKVFDKYTDYFGMSTEDPKTSAMKEFIPDEEISKVFFSVFRMPTLPSSNQKINKNILKQNYSEKNYNDDKKDLIRALTLLKSRLIDASKKAQVKEDECITKRKSYISELESLKNQNINKITLYVALPLFAFILIAMFLIPSQYMNKKVQILFIEKNIIKDVLTIFLLTSTIILLGLSKVIDSQIIGTLLGGISVYVLQRGLESKQNDEISKSQEEVKKQTESDSLKEANKSTDSKETNETTGPKESDKTSETTEPKESEDTNETTKLK